MGSYWPEITYLRNFEIEGSTCVNVNPEIRKNLLDMKKSVTLFLLMVLSSGACIADDSKDLISISVLGTTITQLPESVDLIVANPSEHAAELIEHGGEKNSGIAHSVIYQRVLYIFQTPNSWKMDNGGRFSEGDVIYTFRVSSEKEKEEFVTSNELELLGQMAERAGQSPSIYRATSPGFFVLLIMPEYYFACSMHPKVRMREPGECPICGMDLMKMKERE